MKKSKTLILLLAFLTSSVSPKNEATPYFKSKSQLSELDFQNFLNHTDSRLPNYKKYFKKYSELYQIPLKLLVAVAYQESKWDNEATSPTGVKGLMQLTSQTAQHIGVTDREDAHQSIRGGAYYLRYLFDKTPKELSSYERWALALSAYNIGWGHLQDAFHLSLQLNKNPYNWNEFKKILPQLENEKYYSHLNHGFARGRETVDFVNKVFGYYNLLDRNRLR